jgi:hypothetical protein
MKTTTTNGSTGGNGGKSSISGTLASIARTEGLRGLFKGNGASVLRIVPYSALHFGAYEQYREWLVRALKLDREEEESQGKEDAKQKQKKRVPPWVDLLEPKPSSRKVLSFSPLSFSSPRPLLSLSFFISILDKKRHNQSCGWVFSDK